jgi:hypothetical protein
LQSRPQRLKPSETLRTGLQTPSGTGKRYGRGCKPRPAPGSFVFLAGRDLQSRPQRLKPSETLRTGLQTPSGTGKRYGRGCKLLAGRDLQSRPQRLKPSETLRTGLQTPSGTGILRLFSWTGFAIPSATFEAIRNVTDRVANPVRHRETLRTGLQTPSGTGKRYGQGCKPRPAPGNVTDGVANPVRHRERYGRGCKPRPAQGRFIAYFCPIVFPTPFLRLVPQIHRQRRY